MVRPSIFDVVLRGMTSNCMHPHCMYIVTYRQQLGCLWSYSWHNTLHYNIHAALLNYVVVLMCQMTFDNHARKAPTRSLTRPVYTRRIPQLRCHIFCRESCINFVEPCTTKSAACMQACPSLTSNCFALRYIIWLASRKRPSFNINQLSWRPSFDGRRPDG